MRQKKAITKELKTRYNKATKKRKTIMLDEFCATTGYNRCYASWLLTQKKEKVLGYIRSQGKTIKFVAAKAKPRKRKRPRIYTYDVFLALKKIWTVFDFICGKRLAPFMAEAVAKLEEYKEIELTEDVRKKLTKISASTIDRLLKKEKKKFRLGKGRSGTKPGSLLKKQIPVRTFAQWDEKRPGFCEFDLVGHDGGNTSGDYAQSLNFTDIATCWDETAAAKNKAQKHVFRAIKTRTGSKVTKKYDRARTPYRRVLESEHIDDKIKRNLKKEYDSLNPAELKRKITRLQDKLLKLNTLKQKVRREITVNESAYGYIKG